MITFSQFTAFGRNAVSYVAGAVTALVSFGLLSNADGGKITEALTQIVTGVTTAAGGTATLVSIVAALYAARTASPASQIAAAAANPDVKKIVTSAKTADASTSDKVVSK